MNNSDHQHQPQYLIKVLVPIPIRLKELIDKYAFDNDISVSHAIRLGVACLLQLPNPEEIADVTHRTHPKGTYNKTKAQTERRRKERAIAKLVKEKPEILQQIQSLMEKTADA